LAKNKGEPWTLAKSFKNSTVLAPWQPWNKEFLTSDIQLKINGEVRQFGNMRDLIFSVDQVIQFLVEHFPVCEGDVILMGTPAGVGPINDGDFLEADLGPFVEHHWNVEQSVDTF
jgi:2-keto-4-pentenoate hydratase/2-oxohepta-3-ene-1,7-dioic acid hydratase in catechol pathway